MRSGRAFPFLHQKSHPIVVDTNSIVEVGEGAVLTLDGKKVMGINKLQGLIYMLMTLHLEEWKII